MFSKKKLTFTYKNQKPKYTEYGVWHDKSLHIFPVLHYNIFHLSSFIQWRDAEWCHNLEH